ACSAGTRYTPAGTGAGSETMFGSRHVLPRSLVAACALGAPTPFSRCHGVQPPAAAPPATPANLIEVSWAVSYATIPDLAAAAELVITGVVLPPPPPEVEANGL